MSEPYGPNWSEQAAYVITAPDEFEMAGYDGNMSSWRSFGEWCHNLKIGRDVLPPDLTEKLRKITTMTEHKEEKSEIAEIEFEEFQKVDLRVAEVLKAERVPKTDKLMQLEVDDGKGTRQILAGIAATYKPDDIIGKKIILVANLKPVKIRGIQSNGMLLAAVSDDDLSLLTLEKDIPAGSKVR